MSVNIPIHRNILINILKEIYGSKIAPYLGFKGGTAMLVFYKLTRFSVDLDFDLLDLSKEELVFETIKQILEKYGTVKAQNKRYSLFFLLSYEGKHENYQNVKIEVNKRNFGSNYEIKHFLGIPIQVMVQEDLAANKLVAMYERMGKTNRDIFDAHFILKNNWPINKIIVENRTKMKFVDFTQKCINELEKINNRSILSGIGELLDEKQKYWVKNNLKNDTIFLLGLVSYK